MGASPNLNRITNASGVVDRYFKVQELEISLD